MKFSFGNDIIQTGPRTQISLTENDIDTDFDMSHKTCNRSLHKVYERLIMNT